jgi:hypothetical protein
MPKFLCDNRTQEGAEMWLNIGLALAALFIAVYAARKDPVPREKNILIVVAIIVFGFSVWKAIDDESEKEFMQNMLISTIIPSNSAYVKLYDDVNEAATKIGYVVQDSCNHSDDGMICLLYKKEEAHSAKNNAYSATVVFDKQEVAEMYANRMRKCSNSKLVSDAIQKVYEPKELREEFLDRVGILGFGIFFDMFNPTTTSLFDLRTATRYAPPSYPA